MLAVEESSEPTKTVLERLEPKSKAFVIVTFFALAMLMIFMVLAIMIGGRRMRRIARERGGFELPKDEIGERIKKEGKIPQVSLPDGVDEDLSTSETLLDSAASRETKTPNSPE